MALLIHHLHVSQSERILWLCEELGIDYNIKTYDRAPLLAPAEYKALHPQGTAPVIQHGDLVLAESAACVEYISNKVAPSASSGGSRKLFLSPEDPEYAQFLYWWHWVNSTFQPSLEKAMAAAHARSKGALDESSPLAIMARERPQRALNALNERLKDNEWLAGKQFSAADIMVVFPLTTMRYFNQYSLSEHRNILKYLERVSQREAYQKAMKRGDPGMELALGPDPPKKKSA
jgi:glutathione S-transferase